MSRPSSQMKTILDRLAVEDAGLPDPTLCPAHEGRKQAEAANLRWNVDLPDMERIEEVHVSGSQGDIPCRILTPKGTPRGTILFIHGGGWAFCSMATHERCARVLAIEAQATVVMCDYRLAPEHPYPAGLDDCTAVWRALAQAQAPFSTIKGPFALSGDSAGANLAMGVMLDSGPKPDCGLLFYGVYDTDFASPSYIDAAQGPGLTRDKMCRYWDWYADAAQRLAPQVAPMRASDAALMALPQLYLNAAEIDPLRSDTERLFARLSKLGRKDRFHLHGGVVHGFLQMTTVLEEARLALGSAGAAFRAFTKEPPHDQTENDD
ncbi:alpha/beta hydrolase [Pacificibacter marinus]|uniref:Carboxylesterase NlhH n=1 Tax=Pacificibacter marinus TaxID=658057 RepID=A0A1Y5RA85_9RHOB|nr:alpha/beta hydrolase [Pacificibacter marinus]SEK27874.1 acetyl esterase [Pacificibacter marinus]SLN11594.1 Carboxylesterase NlhH [Pacificibacter marinus]